MGHKQREPGREPRDGAAPASHRLAEGPVPYDRGAPAGVLALQHSAGNRALARSLSQANARALQREPGPTPVPQAPPQANDKAGELRELINGFSGLVTAAITDDGRTLDTVHFDAGLAAGDRALLERIRAVLIEAQGASPDERQRAAAAWPGLEAKLHAEVAVGRTLGLPVEKLAATEDNIALVGEKYVHAAHKGPSEVENADDYADFIHAVEHLLNVTEEQRTDMTDAVRALNQDETDKSQRSELAGVQFGAHLSKRHRHLLENLREVLILARTHGSTRQAVQQWDAILPDLRHVFTRAPMFVGAGSHEVGQRLDRISRELIHGGAYAEAHQKALAQSDVKNPRDLLDQQRLVEAVESIREVDEFVKKGQELTSSVALQAIFEAKGIEPNFGAAVFDLVHGSFEISKLLEEFQKKGLIGKGLTVAELADKIFSTTKAAAEGVFGYVKHFALEEVEKAVAAGAEDLAEEWKGIGEWAAGKLEYLEKVGKVAVIITVVVSAAKVVNHLIHHRWAEAAKEAATTAIGVGAGVAGGVAGSAMFAGISVTIAAEIEGLKGAAAMIAYCREENMKEAAGDVLNIVEAAASIEALDLVADLKLLSDPANAGEAKLIEAKLASDAVWWERHLQRLSELVNDNRPSRIGGQPELLAKLGPDAVAVMRAGVAGQSPEAMAEQIRLVFEGTNEMVKFIGEQRTEKREKAKEEREEAEKKEKE